MCLPQHLGPPSSVKAGGASQTAHLIHRLLDSLPAGERILSLPQECSRWTVCPTGLIQGGGLSRSGALKPVGSLPCEPELEHCLGLPLPRSTVAGLPGTSPAHMVSNNSLEPLILLGFISTVGVNFLIYYPLCLSFPSSSLSRAWKRPQQPRTSLQRPRPSLTLPQLPLHFQEKVH